MSNVRLLVAVGILLILSLFKSCQEINYAVWGAEKEAHISMITKKTGKYGRDLGTFGLTFTTPAPKTGNGQIIGGFTVSADELANYRVGDPVQIIYYESNGRYYSRSVDESNMIWILITVVFLIIGAVWSWKVWQQLKIDVAQSKR